MCRRRHVYRGKHVCRGRPEGKYRPLFTIYIYVCMYVFCMTLRKLVIRTCIMVLWSYIVFALSQLRLGFALSKVRLGYCSKALIINVVYGQTFMCKLVHMWYRKVWFLNLIPSFSFCINITKSKVLKSFINVNVV